jgi:hypothetical protein
VPLRAGFDVYTDYLGDGVRLQEGSAGISLFTPGARSGRFALSWAQPAQYETLTFAFTASVDWAGLAADGASVVFWAKNSAAGDFDVRFVDSPLTGLPWRAAATVTAAQVPADGEWHEVTLPLAGFADAGAYSDGVWLAPRGEFTWERVAALQFVAETGALPGTLQIDDLRIAAPAAGDLATVLRTFFARITALIHRLVDALNGVGGPA